VNVIPFLVTLVGPILGCVGWLVQAPWLLWVGIAVCTLNLVLNLASGVMKLPILPAIFMLVAAVATSPWWYGVAIGLLVYTGLEALGESYARLRASSNRGDA
jgi:hypothetical protein